MTQSYAPCGDGNCSITTFIFSTNRHNLMPLAGTETPAGTEIRRFVSRHNLMPLAGTETAKMLGFRTAQERTQSYAPCGDGNLPAHIYAQGFARHNLMPLAGTETLLSFLSLLFTSDTILCPLRGRKRKRAKLSELNRRHNLMPLTGTKKKKLYDQLLFVCPEYAF